MKKKLLVTIQSIANELGISPSTVSRAMNGLGKKSRISEETIRAVHDTANKLGYSPNNIAKSLRLKKTSTIGLVVPDISNPWFAKIAMRIEEASKKRGYHIFLCNSGNDIEMEISSLRALQDWSVDGIIIVPIGVESAHILKISDNGVPIVLIDRFFENTDLPYISTDDFEASFRATEYLIENGHRRIVCIQGVVGTSSNNQRVGGYKRAISHYNIPLDEYLIVGDDFSFKNGYQQAMRLLKHIDKDNITAVFSTGNQVTLGVIKAFKEKGINVPDDISIVSYDEENYSELLSTPLSTVSHLQDEELGIFALKLLFDKQVTSEDKHILLPTKLIKRSSVKCISS